MNKAPHSLSDPGTQIPLRAGTEMGEGRLLNWKNSIYLKETEKKRCGSDLWQDLVAVAP